MFWVCIGLATLLNVLTEGENEELAASTCPGRITEIKSPETMPQDESVWPSSGIESFPFKDKLNSISSLLKSTQNKCHHMKFFELT